MKTRLFKKPLILTMVLTMLLSSFGFKFSAFADVNQTSTKITIFHTNDMHGRLLDAFNTAKPPALTQIGSDYTAAIKESVPNSLLIDAGDATQGLPFATISKGADVIKLMNAAGYDGMVLGNHEFDYNKDQALINAKLANFPVISANTMLNGQPFLAGVNGNDGEDFIKTVNGLKVGFFGVTTQETVYKTNPANLPGITFEDPISISKSEVSKLKSEGANVIVGIMHIGNDPSSDPTSEDIAKSVDGINVIIDGHSHTIENKLVNNTLIAQTACYNANLGRVDISVTSDGKVSATESLISAATVATAYTPDKTVNTLATQINASQSPMFSNIVGRTNTSLWAGTVNGMSVARLGETNLGDLVADAMVDGAKSQVKGTEFASLPVVALENGGGIRDSIPAGNINQGQITTVLPFGNILSLKEVTPDLLYQTLENGVSKITVPNTSTGVLSGADGRFPQISGMRFEYNPKNPVLSRLSKIVLLNADGSDKQVLDKNDTNTKIVLVSNDYEVGGGDGYTMLGTLKNIGEGNALDVITSQYITNLTAQNGGTFSYPAYQGRVKISSDFIYKPYTATITVKNGSTSVTSSAITYAIDNGTSTQATTDGNGILTIPNVPSGPHNVNISYKNLAVTSYINDVIGSISVTATLVPAIYTLTYTAGSNGTTTGSAIQVVNSGANGTVVTAVPNAGYYFVGWSDGVTTATRTDSNVKATVSVTAIFAQTSSSGGSRSNSSGGGTSIQTASTPATTTIKADVLDDKTGQSAKSIDAQVTTEADGTKTVTMKSADAIVVKQADGTQSTLTDFSKLSFSTPITLTGTLQSSSVTIASDGTIQVKGLANNTESKFSVTYDLGNGQKITIGSMDVKVASNGDVSLTSTLIDPYGIVTDEATGKAIAGVNVTLYYANTERNKVAGKAPDTLVPLPGIDGFKHNDNKNPQISDASGAYGFMVFSTSDYYIVGTKDGYTNYTSPTISVEQEIVKWNFAMHIKGIERLAGNSRIDTSLAIAKATYQNTLSNVILATSENYTDALSGSVLAYKLTAPILLVGTSSEDQAKVLDYLKANLDSTGKVYILGGSGAVSTDIEAKITALGFKNILRLGGADRYETAVKIADTIGVKEGTPLVLVSGENYADALSISSTAAVNQYPIFIVSKAGISDLLEKEISTIKPSKVFIIGADGAVSTALEDQVSQIGTVDKGNIVRIGGASRFETSLAVAKYFNLTGTISCIATGNDFPDALAGSIYAAKNSAHIILVNKVLTDSEITYLQTEKIVGSTIFGGESVVSNDIEQQLNKILGK